MFDFLKRRNYLIIQTGYEGIEKLCYLTKNKDKAIKELKRLQDLEIEEEISRSVKLAQEGFPYDTETLNNFILRTRRFQKIKDFFCIQIWDGKEFNCYCNELRIPPSELMLR